jgi:hypothetical protein
MVRERPEVIQLCVFIGQRGVNINHEKRIIDVTVIFVFARMIEDGSDPACTPFSIREPKDNSAVSTRLGGDLKCFS